jgi:hypothetical protein
VSSSMWEIRHLVGKRTNRSSFSEEIAISVEGFESVFG